MDKITQKKINSANEKLINDIYKNSKKIKDLITEEKPYAKLHQLQLITNISTDYKLIQTQITEINDLIIENFKLSKKIKENSKMFHELDEKILEDIYEKFSYFKDNNIQLMDLKKRYLPKKYIKSK